MRAVVQRVIESNVEVNNEIIANIGNGLLVFVGVSVFDEEKDIFWLADKIVNLRIFEDEKGKMNKSLLETKGQLLIVSQFTLYGDCRKGRRPSFTESANPKKAEILYNKFVDFLKEKYSLNVQTGKFQAHMKVKIINDGPVTFLLDSKKNF